MNKLLKSLPLEIENIVNKYIEELTISQKFKKVLNEIKKIEYEFYEPTTSKRIFKNKSIIYFDERENNYILVSTYNLLTETLQDIEIEDEHNKCTITFD